MIKQGGSRKILKSYTLLNVKHCSSNETGWSTATRKSEWEPVATNVLVTSQSNGSTGLQEN